MTQKYIVEVDQKGQIVGQPSPYAEQARVTRENYEPNLGDFVSILPSYVDNILFTGIAIILLFKTFFIVRQQSVSIIERFGRYNRTAKAGLAFKIPFIEKIVGDLDLRVQELQIPVETKTKDNVFVTVAVTVQYMVSEKLYEAFYKLVNTREQMASYIFDVVRGEVPRLDLDSVFESKDSIANAVKIQLQQSMDDFGLTIIQTLVTDIEPAKVVREAMNTINEQKRLREAATEKGEAEKILMVKAAEAEAEARRLSGEGVANQRKAIVEGLKESIKNMTEATGVKENEVMSLVLLTQYFDTLKEIGSDGNAKVVFLPSSPNGMTQFGNEIRTAILGS